MLQTNSLSGICQQYFPISDSSNIWFEYFQAEPNYEYYYQQWQIKNDTIIDGIQYKFLKHLFQSITPSYDPGYHLIFSDVVEITEPLYFIRDDIAAQKVYLLTSYAGFNEETLLFNFDLSVGDTVDFGVESPLKRVMEIDSVDIGGEMHKRLKIANEADWTSPYVDVIEGVGSTFGLLYNMDPPFEETTEIICYSHQGISTDNFYEGMPPEPVDASSICEFMEPTTVQNYYSPYTLQIQPNPAESHISFSIADAVTGQFEMSLFNVLGQKIYSANQISSMPVMLDISSFKPGPYQLLISDGKDYWSARFIKQ